MTNSVAVTLRRNVRKTTARLFKTAASLFISVILASCGGDDEGGSNNNPPPSAQVTLNVTGLRNGQQLTLTNNGNDQITVSRNGSVAFAKTIAVNAPYSVTLATAPTAQTCTINGGTGTVASDQPIVVNVSCGPTILHSFDNFNVEPNVGSSPLIMLASDGNVYGTTQAGGTYGFGTLFVMTPAGVVTELHQFAGGDTDGAQPSAKLIEGSDGILYGTTSSGGPLNRGTIFKITPGGAYTQLYAFGDTSDPTDVSNGFSPRELVLFEGELYGTTYYGGLTINAGRYQLGFGTVFKLTSSNNLVVLHRFTGTAEGGIYPSSLTASGDGNFYGITAGDDLDAEGGSVFRITPTGTMTIVHYFGGFRDSTFTFADASRPRGPLALDAAGNIYVTFFTAATSSHAYGSIYRLSPTGALSLLHSFQSTVPSGAANEGANPTGVIFGTDGNLYGITPNGGQDFHGTIYSITPTGTFQLLHSFAGGSSGDTPFSLIQGPAGIFYGTSRFGGANGAGTIFKF